MSITTTACKSSDSLDTKSMQRSVRYTAASPGHIVTALGNLATQQFARGIDAAANPIPFPHAGAIRGTLGSNLELQAAFDPEGCAIRGVPAYTNGNQSYFSHSSASLHIAAHEAAHQYQHAGLTCDAGLGAEGHASAVADAVVRGRGASGLMGRLGQRVPAAERNYVETDGGRLADNSMAFVSGKELYADAGMIAGANSILQSQQSGVTLTAGGGGRLFDHPDGGSSHLMRANVRVSTDPDAWLTPDFYDKCGRAAREVIGPSGEDRMPVGVIRDEVDGVIETPEAALKSGSMNIADPREIVALAFYMASEIAKIEGYADMTQAEREQERQEISENYAQMSDEEKRELISVLIDTGKLDEEVARRLGINEYAEPEVGEAYMIRDVSHDKADEGNFHWAAVVLVAGSDNVTFESTATQGDYDATNTSWSFEMYGVGKQSFHAKNAPGLGGDSARTLRMRRPSADDEVNARGSSTGDLVERYNKATDKDEKEKIEQALAARVISVVVFVSATEDMTGDDDVFVNVSNGSHSHETSTISIGDGEAGSFSISMAGFGPDPGTLSIKVYEWDWESNDLMATISLGPPYGSKSVGAQGYVIQVSL